MEDEHALAGIDAATVARIFALWDKMTCLEAADVDHALHTLLQDLCDLLAAKTALSMVAVLMPHLGEEDPAHSWRPRHVTHLHPGPRARANTAQAMRLHEDGTRDITVLNNISHAGTWRARRLCELAPPEWFESPFYEQFYLRMGRTDAIWVGCPVNTDLELYVGLFRGSGQAPFTPRDSDTALFAMRGLTWFLKRYLLSLGLDLAQAPLTCMERRVLSQLLNGHAQQAIANELSQSLYTTHDHIKSIYRKFNVNTRSALMSLWLSRA